ncbi:MAG: hypothetical protein B1H12_09420 [Desulfobacteraceae bacterium 4484_190.2]|nr:MAG: hypothetical protein B1H12_09420 [Desulfobacteraceae bacterium 4484_190.2]
MKKKLLSILATGLFLIGVTGIANAITISVSQGGNILGNIKSYSGNLSGAENYDWYNAKNHVHNGPTAVEKQGQIFFYEGSDGLSFNTIFSSVGDNTISKVEWDITIAGSTSDPSVLVTDDQCELTESSTDNVFEGRWKYVQYLGDGGTIGEISGNTWSVTIDPVFYDNITSLKAYGTSNSISLNLDLNKKIVFTIANSSAPVPEPATMLLFGTGLAGLVGIKLSKKKK